MTIRARSESSELATEDPRQREHESSAGGPPDEVGDPPEPEGRPVEGPDTDWIHLPDPIQEAIKGLSERIAELEQKLADARGETAAESDSADVTELHPKKGPSSAGG